eukprot:CAMPEP_0197002062 /NCGR_PEP_ID=MMETSP1380-20130617/6618_1 /TAXON_ID=5936 /ORGANISM="Euplotes crassus, Strain CT5" /LENGTH=334 /DNA_ID=CAMNT_0042420001 /DNA_START=44 /DNA_END=1048 /DNA_ORIENTATION=+
MKVLPILIAAGVLTAAYFTLSSSTVDELDLQFTQFTTQFDKNYQNEDEYNFRRSIFEKNLKVINEHNAEGKSWTLGTNEFTDWTDEEYKRLLGLKSTVSATAQSEKIGMLPTNCKKMPRKGIDYRGTNRVGRVVSQGSCGSCWAFAATAALEAAYAKEHGEFVKFSEQHIVDCDKFSHGCNGGLMANGFIHWMRHAPILEKDYEYTAKDGKCKEDSIDTEFDVLPFGYRVDVTHECLYEALTHNVVAVSIRAENDKFRHYESGVIDVEDDCGTEIDHGVTLVGYDEDEDAWIVRNSWGLSWGEEGYVKIRRGEDYGVCGINQQNAQAVYDHSEY